MRRVSPRVPASSENRITRSDHVPIIIGRFTKDRIAHSRQEQPQYNHPSSRRNFGIWNETLATKTIGTWKRSKFDLFQFGRICHHRPIGSNNFYSIPFARWGRVRKGKANETAQTMRIHSRNNKKQVEAKEPKPTDEVMVSVNWRRNNDVKLIKHDSETYENRRPHRTQISRLLKVVNRYYEFRRLYCLNWIGKARVWFWIQTDTCPTQHTQNWLDAQAALMMNDDDQSDEHEPVAKSFP